MRLAQVLMAEGQMPSEAIVTCTEGLICESCGGSAHEKPWGRVQVQRAPDGAVIRKTPVGPGCRNCSEALCEALLPNIDSLETAWAAEVTREVVPDYVRRRNGAPSLHRKHSAAVVTRHSTNWQEEYDPVPLAEVTKKCSRDELLRRGLRAVKFKMEKGVGER